MTETHVPGSLARPAQRSLLVPALVIMAVAFSGIAGCTGAGSGNTTLPARVAGTNGNAVVLPDLGTAVTAPVPVSGQPEVAVDLVAKDMAYSRTTIVVPAGALVVVNFHNREDPGSSQVTGIAHNFAVYDSPAAGTMIFSGEIITGGGDAVYRFTAPETPGTYFFRCDVHPDVMNGQFIVE